MPNASDPYGAYAYQERIIRENRFMLSVSSLGGSLSASRGGISPRTSKNCTMDNTTNSRPATPRAEGGIVLNTLSGELTREGGSDEYNGRLASPRGVPINKRTADICAPMPTSPRQQQLLEQRVNELEAELAKERKGRKEINSKLQQLETILEAKLSAEQRSPMKEEGTSSSPNKGSLPAIPTSNAFRSPRRMPHNLY